MTRPPGTLFVVATPIGNLEDLTFRALRTLGEVDLIAAEDTRRTAKLLAHYNIRRPVLSLRTHNEMREGPKLVGRMLAGETVALVTDAGTPGVSDPGAHLVGLTREAGLKVVPIPGCSAVTAALSVSGLAVSSFRFAGFPPAQGRARDLWFEDLALTSETVIFLESPHRIRLTLAETAAVSTNRQIFVFREISKINEDLVEYTHKTDVSSLERGELTVIVSQKPDESQDLPTDVEITRLFGELTNGRVFPADEALNLLGRLTRLANPHSKNRLKRAILSAKRQKHGPA